jgi:hypothetical protein
MTVYIIDRVSLSAFDPSALALPHGRGDRGGHGWLWRKTRSLAAAPGGLFPARVRSRNRQLRGVDAEYPACRYEPRCRRDAGHAAHDCVLAIDRDDVRVTRTSSEIPQMNRTEGNLRCAEQKRMEENEGPARCTRFERTPNAHLGGGPIKLRVGWDNQMSGRPLFASLPSVSCVFSVHSAFSPMPSVIRSSLAPSFGAGV